LSDLYALKAEGPAYPSGRFPVLRRALSVVCQSGPLL